MVKQVDPSVANSPYVIYALMIVAVISILFGAVNKGTTGFGAWMGSLRRIGADAKAADIKSRDAQIENLSKDLDLERRARRQDRLDFESQLDERDDKVREHIKWDWKVYNVLVLTGLLDEKSKPPPLH